jgi:tetratricopeptide (TPR) repeat protein
MSQPAPAPAPPGLEATSAPFNEDFQSLCGGPASSPQERARRQSALAALQDRFALAARAAAERLVAERALPKAQRTIHPLDSKGLTYGDWFAVGSLLLKFANDDKGLYGGDERAHKAANLELQAISALRCVPGLDALHTTLTALVHVRGHCVVVTALAPIESARTRVSLGAADAPEIANVYLSPFVRRIAGYFNLAPQRVPMSYYTRKVPQEPDTDGEELVSLALAADVEGHWGQDRRRYMVNLTQLMPPQPPQPGDPVNGAQFLHWRPEFMARRCVGNALFCDVSAIASSSVRAEYVPRFSAAWRVYTGEAIAAAAARVDALQGGESVATAVHAEGVNLRHLGLVYETCARAEARRAVACEAAARTVKQLWRALQRFAEKQEAAADNAWQAVALDVFNCLVCPIINAGKPVTAEALWALLLRGVMSGVVGGAGEVVWEERLLARAMAAKFVPGGQALAREFAQSSAAEETAAALARVLGLRAVGAGESVAAWVEAVAAAPPPPKVKLAAAPPVLEHAEVERLLLEELATRERLLEGKERDPQLRPTLAALLRLYREWREGEAKGALVAQRLLALGEAAGVSELERAEDEDEAALFHCSLGRLDEALEHVEKGVAMRVSQLGAEHPAVARGLDMLSRGADAQLQPLGALQLLQRSLAILLKRLGPASLAVADSHAAIGSASMALGRYAEAIEHHRKSLAIRLEQLGPEHVGVAANHADLARVLLCESQYAEALQHLEKSLAIRLKRLGPDDVAVAEAHCEIGKCLTGEGHYAEALQHFEESLAICLKQLGPEHLSVGDIYVGIARVLALEGRFAEAIQHYEKNLAIQLKRRGPDCDAVAIMYHSIGSALCEQSRFAEGMQLYEKSLAIALKVMGPEHHEVAKLYSDMAVVLEEEGRGAEALQYLQKSVAATLKHLGPEHPDVATAYCNMASVLEKQGLNDEAMQLYEKALAVMLKSLGPDHPDVAMPHQGMATIFLKQKRFTEALEHQQKGIDITIKELGPTHPDVGSALVALGNVYISMHRPDEALQYYKKAFAILAKGLGPDHIEVASCLSNMSNVFNLRGQHAEALKCLKKSLAIRLAEGGSKDHDTAVVYANLANTLGSLGRFRTAMQCALHANLLLLNTLGPAHATSQSVRRLATQLFASCLE